MATGTVGTTARRYHTSQVHYLRGVVTFGDPEVTLGVIPANALIVKPMSGAMVLTAFDAGTTNTIDIGTPADADRFGSALAGGSVAFVPLDENDMRVSADTTVVAAYNESGTAATAGEAEIVVAYVV